MTAPEQPLDRSAEARPGLGRRSELCRVGRRDVERDRPFRGALDLGRVDEAALAPAAVSITSPSKMCSGRLSSTSTTLPISSAVPADHGRAELEGGVVHRVAVVSLVHLP